MSTYKAAILGKEHNGESFYEASLSEPMSCIIGAYHASYHTIVGKYEHNMGMVEGGKMAILAAADQVCL